MAPPDWPARPPGAPPLRIPKLAYRNPLPADQSSIMSHTSQATSSSDTASTEPFPDFQPSIASSHAASSPLRSTFDTRSLTSPSLASDTSKSSSRSSTSSTKRKANGMLSFLTLKEPSQCALEQFAEQQRKQGAGKGGTLTAVGVVSVTPPKLPASVPRVNSKWDGIPESIKARDSSSRKRNSSMSTSTTTTTSRFSTVRSTPSVFSFASEMSHGPPNTLASAASSISDFSTGPPSTTDERHEAGPSAMDSSITTSAMSSPSTSPLPRITCFFAEDPTSGANLPVSQEEPSFGRATVKPPPPALTLSQPPSCKRVAALATPPASPLHANDKTQAESDEVSFRGFLAGEAQPIALDDDEDDEDTTRANLEFLYEMQQTATSSPLPSPTLEGPPRPKTTNFSRPRPHQPVNLVPDFSHLSLAATTPRRQGFGGLPTLYEASIISNENGSIAELPEFGDREKETNHVKDSDAVSITSSITPSEMSASWYQSSRERLGLGGRLRKDGALPWDRPGELQPGKRRKNPLSMFGKSTASTQRDDGISRASLGAQYMRPS